MSHRAARLTVHGRRILVERVLAGRPVAAEMGVSRPTAHKWARRWRAEGDTGLAVRSSRPRTTPRRASASLEARLDPVSDPVPLPRAPRGPRPGRSTPATLPAPRWRCGR